MSDFTIVQRLFLAFILGGILGYEREKAGHSPGLRTHILVCLGSALIMLISIYLCELYVGRMSVDPGRIAAGVVTGIGFLGAGAIIRDTVGVKGLTTAASVWVASAIGLAVGCGFLLGAAITTFISFLTLAILKKLEKAI